MKRLIALALVLVTFSSAEEQHKGPRGGCYTTVTSKTGKTYKKYAPCKVVTK